MKILQIITVGHVFYGAQKHVLQLSEKLLANGHEVLVLCGTQGELTERLAEAGVEFRQVKSMLHPISPVTDVKAVLELRKNIQAFKPDVVATHSSKAGIVGRIAAWTCGVPSVFTAHGWSFADGVPARQRKIALVCEKACGLLSKRVIAVAESEREYGLEHKAVKADRLVCVYYGVEDTAGEGIDRSSRKRCTELVMVAGFRPQKDHATLFQALAKIQHLDWHLTLLGDGNLMSQTQQLAAELELSDRISFEGAVRDVDSYLRKADVLVLITNWEGMPISTIEGMAFGLPIIATDVAGTKEQVLEGENGLLVERGSVEGVRSALEALISDREKRVEYGKKSRALYTELFTIEAMYSRTVSEYAKVCGKPIESGTKAALFSD